MCQTTKTLLEHMDRDYMRMKVFSGEFSIESGLG
jgi:hypothetical protein